MDVYSFYVLYSKLLIKLANKKPWTKIPKHSINTAYFYFLHSYVYLTPDKNIFNFYLLTSLSLTTDIVVVRIIGVVIGVVIVTSSSSIIVTGSSSTSSIGSSKLSGSNSSPGSIWNKHISDGLSKSGHLLCSLFR